ncbi:MAG: hypothetical protein E7442_09040 [Ruminococcaceae bacterium]|nr:hypothetical protein [Oscillospiraceae bacterium]
MKKAITILLIGVLCLFAACGGSEEPVVEAAPQATGVPMTEAEPEGTVEEAEPVAQKPAEIRVIAEEPAELDPISIHSLDKTCLLEVYEPLFYTESLGGELLGGLADTARGEFGGYDHAANTGVYTIYLHAGIRDHAGNAFTAADAAFCYQRQAEMEAWTDWQDAAAVDDTTLELRFARELSAPGDLRRCLTSVYLYTQKAFESSDGFVSEAVGTGPYKLESYTPGEEMLLAECDYWAGDTRSARAAANVSTIRYLFIEGAAERVIALETGKADMADCLDYADTADFRGEGVYTDTFRLAEGWHTTNDILIPNVSWASLMKEQNLRLGVFYAIDNDQLAGCFGEGGGRAAFSVGNPDYPDNAEAWRSAGNHMTEARGVNEVRTFLRQAAYVNEAITLLVTAGTSGEQLASAIQTMLHPMSITINIVAVDAETFEATLQKESEWDMAILSVEAESSVAEIWHSIWTDRAVGSTCVGFLRDSVLLTHLRALDRESDCTEETLTAFLSYVAEKGYATGLAQKCRPSVVPVGVHEVYLSARGELFPGACIYLIE